jgi:hypothetical protein
VAAKELPLRRIQMPASQAQRRLEYFRQQAAELRKSMESSMQEAELLQVGEEKLGYGDNNIVLSHGEIGLNNEDPGVGGRLSSEGSDVKFGGSLRTDLAIDHLIYEGNKVLNPQMQYRPQNVVSYYPAVLTLPPGLISGLFKGVLTGVMMTVKMARSEET